MYQISQETDADWWEVEALFDLSFAPGREALSSYQLRHNVPPVTELCMIARDGEGILAAAIRFWPIRIGEHHAPALLLGPIAVHPTRQGEGLGEQLINHSIDLARKSGWERVILVGDEPYYQRFGFQKAPDLVFPPPTNPDRILRKELKDHAFSDVYGEIFAETVYSKIPRT